MLRPPEDEGWQVVPSEWWRISYTAVSWAYTEVAAGNKVASSTVSLFPNTRSDNLHKEDLSAGDDGRLNPDLVGCQSAMATVESYELNVGFHWAPSEIEVQAQPDLTWVRKEEHVARTKERWDELVRALTGGLSISDCSRESDDDDSLSDVQRSTSSIDLTDSDRSVLSLPMPATPTARRSYANILVKRPSPSRSSSHSSERSPRRLNAAASAFVPSPSKPKLGSISFPSLNHTRTPSPPSPTLNTNFVFPSLNTPPVPEVKIAKDEQGFYSEVQAEPASTPTPSHSRNPSSSLLPAFLQSRRRPPASKTRAIVDRLKSSVLPEPILREAAKPPPTLELPALAKPKPRLAVSEDGDAEDDGGWICMDDASTTSATANENAKTRRTRDLFLALTRTRRRANSSPGRSTTVSCDSDPGTGEAIKVELPSPLPTSASDDGDGWIEGSALLLALEPTGSKAKIPSASPAPSPARKAVALPKPIPPPPRPRRTKRAPPPAQVPVPVPVFARPPPPPPMPGTWYYPPHPHAQQQYAAAAQAQAYMHMQQMQQVQVQMHMQHMRHVSAPNLLPVVPTMHTPRGSVSSTGSGDWIYPVPVPAPQVYSMHAPVFGARA